MCGKKKEPICVHSIRLNTSLSGIAARILHKRFRVNVCVAPRTVQFVTAYECSCMRCLIGSYFHSYCSLFMLTIEYRPAHFHILFILPEALNLYRSQLTEYERQEIDKYPEIWYLGLESCKINAKPGTTLNCGYDDDNGSYNKVSREGF